MSRIYCVCKHSRSAFLFDPDNSYRILISSNRRRNLAAKIYVLRIFKLARMQEETLLYSIQKAIQHKNCDFAR